MDHETEVIKHQMEETRASLTEKLETLEHQVVDTVQDATQVASNTVETVKEVVEDVKDAVTGTVETVKEKVEETVETVKHTLDLKAQVQRHPWPMMGGSVAVGFLLGKLVGRMTAREESPAPAPLPAAAHPVRLHNGKGRVSRSEEKAAEKRASEKGWLGSLTESMGPELAKLKGLAIGATLGIVRDVVTQAVPEELGAKLSEVMNDITVKLGGEPIRGPLLQSSSTEQGSEHDGPEGGSVPAGTQGSIESFKRY
jgi:ElaB/YqjD/DUF883 family membrane-anchored ribosome-binding protein